MGKKATNNEVEDRVNAVYSFLIAGTSPREILQYAAEKWDLKGRAVYDYIRRANEEIAEHAKTYRDAELGKALLRLNKLYASALKLQDYKTCLSIQKEINTLLGLYAPTKSESVMNVRVTGLEDIADADLDKLIKD